LCSEFCLYLYRHENDEALRADGFLEVELQVITGATDETGFNKLRVR